MNFGKGKVTTERNSVLDASFQHSQPADLQMKIGAYIEVAIVAFPYKFCRMINILLDEEEGNWRCLPLVLRSGNIGKENHVFDNT